MQDQPVAVMPKPTSSGGLSKVSLVCGICGVILGPLTGIPAIITGHMALGGIKRSGDESQGRGMAIAGLVLGYVFTALGIILIPILAVAGFAAGNAAITKAKYLKTMAAEGAIESAVNNFMTEFGVLPHGGSEDTTLLTSSDKELLEVLLGLETKINKGGIKFLSMKEGKDKKDGLIYSADGRAVLGLYDPWGGGYHVRLDLDYDEVLEVNGEVLNGRRVAVWSDGPDRKPDTEDDIKSW